MYPDACIHHQQVGADGEEQVVALLRVKTRLESPEGNLRELTRDINLNCGMYYPPVPRTKG